MVCQDLSPFGTQWYLVVLIQDDLIDFIDRHPLVDDFFGAANHTDMSNQLVVQQCFNSSPRSKARYAQRHSIDGGVIVTSPSETSSQCRFCK